MFHINDAYISLAKDTIFIRQIKHNQTDKRTTIVLLHDSLGCVELWRDWPVLLANTTGFDVLVYDRVGYGKSSKMSSPTRGKDYLKEQAMYLDLLLRKLSLDKVILFGHSDGGSIALLYAALYPQNTLATICEAGHVFVENITLIGIEQACVAYRETDLKKRLEKYHNNSVDDIFYAWVDTWKSTSYRDWNILSELTNITSPLLFMQGTFDQYGSLEQVYATLTAVNGEKQSVVYPQVGHTPHKEVKEQAHFDIVSFLKKHVD